MLHSGPYGDAHRTFLGTSSGRPRDVILPNGEVCSEPFRTTKIDNR